MIEALERAGLHVEKHSAHFAAGAPDQEWLSRAGREEWFVLHKDVRIRRRALERNALIAAGVGAFVFVAGNMRAEEMVQVLERHLAKMLKVARGEKRPFIAGITRSRVVVYPIKHGS